jgi:hypothetical protein
MLMRKYNPEGIGNQLDMYISSAAVSLYDDNDISKARKWLVSADVKFNVIACRMSENDFFPYGEIQEMANRLNALEEDLEGLEAGNE